MNLDGYFIEQVVNFFRFDFYDFFQLFSLLLQGLKKYSPNSGRFGYSISEKYFSLVTSPSIWNIYFDSTVTTPFH